MNSPSRWRYWRRFILPNLSYLLILVAVMALSYWFVIRDSQDNKAAQNAKPTDRMDSFAQQTELTQTSKDGSLLYHASMNDIEHFANDDLKGHNVTFVTTGDKQPPIIIKAQQALWHKEARTVDLSGQVEMIREVEPDDSDSRIMTLKTETITVDMDQGLASSDAFFTMTQGESVLTGTRFRYDYQLRDLDMGGPDGDRIKAQIVNMTKPK